MRTTTVTNGPTTEREERGFAAVSSCLVSIDLEVVVMAGRCQPSVSWPHLAPVFQQPGQYTRGLRLRPLPDCRGDHFLRPRGTGWRHHRQLMEARPGDRAPTWLPAVAR